jgi:2-methylisocitrate lyase-like PEP mutase family enzyme
MNVATNELTNKAERTTREAVKMAFEKTLRVNFADKLQKALMGLFCESKAEELSKDPVLFAMAIDRAFEYSEFGADDFFIEAVTLEVADEYERMLLTA